MPRARKHASLAAIALVALLTACTAWQHPEVQRADGFIAMIATASDEDADAEVGGELVTNDAGCAGVLMDGVFYPVLWPEGTSVSEGGLTLPDGTSIELGGTWSGVGGVGVLPAETNPHLPEECATDAELRAVDADVRAVVAHSATGS
jgi:hypothetical protein